MNTLDRRIFWKRSDGQVAMTMIMKSGKRNGESEDQYIQRVISRIKSAQPDLRDAIPVIKTKSDLQTIFSSSQDPNLEKIRLNGDRIVMDNSVILNRDTYKQKILGIKTKLTSGTPLTPEEADLILGLNR